MKKKAVEFLGRIIVIATVVFIIRALSSVKFDYKILLSPMYLVQILLFSLVSCFSIYISAYAWGFLLAYVSETAVPYREVYPIYIKANLAKYLPGNVLHYAGRNLLGKRLGLFHFDMALSSVAEVILIIFTCIIWCLLLTGNTIWLIFRQYIDQIPTVYIIFAIVIFIILFLALYIYLRKRHKFEQIRHLFKKGFIKTFLFSVLLFSINLFIPAIIFSCIVGWGIQLDLSMIATVVSMHFVAWVIGFAIPGAPGGIGIKEAVLIFMLKDICGEDMIIISAVIHRLVSILGDIFAYITSLLLNRLQTTKKCDDTDH